MRLFDTHAHLDDEQLRPHREHWLTTAREQGLVGINSIGINLATSQESVALAQIDSIIHASVGVHPNYCHQASADDWSAICRLAERPEVVGIGETGLDRYWDYCPFELQQEWFARHIELSYRTQKPLVIHLRDCESDILEMLAKHQRSGQVWGILHSFAGSWETAKACLDWGMLISFSGIVTYKKSGDLRAVAAKIPRERILIETDSPYLAPHPVRGSRPNHPALIRHTAACLAEVWQMSIEAFCELTTENALRVFKLS